MLTPVPQQFEGTLGAFLDQHVVPNLPGAEALAAWTEACLRHASDPIAVLLVRGPRKGALGWQLGHRVVHTDNAPGIWTTLRALDGAFDPDGLPAAMNDGRVPVLAMISKKDRAAWNFAKDALAKRDSSAFWSRHLKHCHIQAVAGRDGASLVARALRNVCPANHFAFPNGQKHFRTTRIDWREPVGSNMKDLGESPIVIGTVQHLIGELLDNVEPGLHERFLAAAEAVQLPAPRPEVRIRIERRQDTPGKPKPQRRQVTNRTGVKRAAGGRGPVSQRQMMCRMWSKYGPNQAKVVKEYAAAERRGEVTRASNTTAMGSPDYAKRLLADGLAKGWL